MTTLFIYITLALVLLLLPIIWAQYAWIACHKKDNEADEYAKPGGVFNAIYKLSQLFIDSALLRTSIYFLIFGLSAAYIFTEMVSNL